MSNPLLSKLLKPDSGVSLWITTILVLIVVFYNPILGLFGVLALVYLLFHNWRTNRQRQKKMQRYIEELYSDIDAAARYAILNLPMPLTMLDFDGRISWYNSKFSEMLGMKDLLGLELEALVHHFDLDKILQEKELVEVKISEKYYHIYANIIKMDQDQNRFTIMLYWIDTTTAKIMIDRYEDEKPIIAMVQVDNYDDVMSEVKEDKRPFLTSEIDSKINLWASRMNALIKKYQNDKYIVVFENKYLENLEVKKFSILDEIREIEAGNKFPVTLSIGVGVSGKNFTQSEEYAFSALELALGRGGDQAVVRKIGNFDFYGGKTKAVEKRNKVKARIIAHGLRPLIDESKRVIIMGHKYPDMDCFGAAIGINRAVISRGKDAYIVLNQVNEAIKNIYEVFKDEPAYKFITSEEALELAEENVLLVVVDTHRPSITECPQLLEDLQRVVLIDHHRRGTEYIENTALKYHEPYASSTCELVTEILQYMENKINIEKIEAEALMAGIAVDTKNFTFKTGVRTFEAASLLKRFGADTTQVKQFFQDDLTTFISKANLVSSAKLYDHDVAISVCYDIVPNATLIAAQAADDLLNIRGIATSFVISMNEENIVFISGRSLGDTNVQMILEKLGGGGHMTTAGAQFKETSMDAVHDMLISAINDYFEESETK